MRAMVCDGGQGRALAASRIGSCCCVFSFKRRLLFMQTLPPVVAAATRPVFACAFGVFVCVSGS